MNDIQKTAVRQAIVAQCDAIKEMLLEKNRKYGNSALEPINIFFKGSAIESIRVRIDDKLKRLQTIGEQPEGDDEDTIMDLIGYFILYKIAKELRP